MTNCSTLAMYGSFDLKIIGASAEFSVLMMTVMMPVMRCIMAMDRVPCISRVPQRSAILHLLRTILLPLRHTTCIRLTPIIFPTINVTRESEMSIVDDYDSALTIRELLLMTKPFDDGVLTLSVSAFLHPTRS